MNKFFFSLLLLSVVLSSAHCEEFEHIKKFQKYHKCDDVSCVYDGFWICAKLQLLSENQVAYFPINRDEKKFITTTSREGTSMLWVMSNFKKAQQEFGYRMKSAQMLYEVDCKFSTFRIREVRMFKKWFAEGEGSSIGFPYGIDWIYPVPGDENTQLIQMICKNR